MAYIYRVPLFDACWWEVIWIRCWHCFCSFENRSQAHKLLTVKFQFIRVSVRCSARSINNSTLYCYAEFSTVMIKLFILVNLLSDFFSGVQAPRQGLCPPYFCIPSTSVCLEHVNPQYILITVWMTFNPPNVKNSDRQGSSLAWVATFSEMRTWIVTLKTKPNQTKKTLPQKGKTKAWVVTLKTKSNQKNKTKQTNKKSPRK